MVNAVMKLMRGTHTEEPVEEPKEEEKIGPLRTLPALPAAEEAPPPTQLQAFGLDITKEDDGQYVDLLDLFQINKYRCYNIVNIL